MGVISWTILGLIAGFIASKIVNRKTGTLPHQAPASAQRTQASPRRRKPEEPFPSKRTLQIALLAVALGDSLPSRATERTTILRVGFARLSTILGLALRANHV
jgi:hypothetical protein